MELVATTGDTFVTDQERVGRAMVEELIEEVRNARRISTRHSHESVTSTNTRSTQAHRGMGGAFGRGLRAQASIASTLLGHPATVLGGVGFMAALFSFKKIDWLIGAGIGLTLSLMR